MNALTARGLELLRHGDFAAARLVLGRAARAGNARAALELGMTFDPKFLRQLGVMGVRPEIEQARHWYEEASRLGSREAQQHLDQLAQTRPK
jgi:TPR repeat protein